VPVDREAAERLDKALRERLGYGLAALRSEREHAIEIELPFLQHVLGSIRLLPAMIGGQCPAEADALGHALAAAL
jgi:AmmeMemoRadiSam system protein B